MLKKTISYTNFNGEEVSEDFFFHLSEAELVELEMSHQGGLSEMLKRLVAAEDGKSIIAEFKNIILGAYGVKSPDGKRFIKNQDLRDEFASTEAYSTLFMELVTDTDRAVEFVNGVIPTGLSANIAKLTGNEAPQTALEVVPKPEPQKVTRVELVEMSHDEFLAMNEKLASGEAILIAENTSDIMKPST